MGDVLTETGGGRFGHAHLPAPGQEPQRTRPPQPRTAPPNGASKPGRKGSKRRPRSLARRLAGRLTRLIAGIAAVALLGATLLYLKLLHGPIPVGALAGASVRALNADLPGLAFAIDDAAVQLSDGGGLELRLNSVELRDGGQSLVATANAANLKLSAAALLRGRIAPSDVTLIEPKFRLAYGAEGQLIFRSNSSPAGAVASSGSSTDQPGTSASRAAPAAGAPATGAARPGADARVDVLRSVAAVIAHLRRDDDTAALRTIGFNAASFEIETTTGKDVWKIDDLSVDLTHRQKRSVVAAKAKLISNGMPWTIDIRAEEAAKAQTLKLDISFSGLVPRNIGRELPAFAALAGLDVPLTGKATASLDAGKGLDQVFVETTIGAGNVYLAGLNGVPLPVDRGALTLKAAGAGVTIDKIAIESGANRLEFQGTIEGDAATGYAFDLHSTTGTLAAAQDGPPLRIDTLALRGKSGPEPGQVEIEEALLKIGDAEIKAAGRMAGTTQFEGRISPMSLPTLKAIWPAALAPRSRAFVIERVSKGEIRGGAFKFSTAGNADPAVKGQSDRQQSLTLEAGDLEVHLRKELPPFEVPRALLRLEGESLELSIPEAQIVAGGNRRLQFRSARFTAVDIDKPRPLAEISLRGLGSLQALVELLDRDPVSILKTNSITIPVAHIDGKIDGQFKVTLPLSDTIASHEVRLDGKARITDGRIKDVFGTYDINAATVNISASDKTIDVRGEMLLAGIAAKLTGNWQTSGPSDTKQSPIRITARLDNADRNLLGLDLDNLVHGEVPIEVTLQRGRGDEQVLHISGDLTSAELMLDELHWRKPVGRPARINFDIGKGRQGKGLELQNFKVSGENIAIDGWIAVGPDNRAREYYFPEFSLNVVSNLEVQGTLRPDRVWEVKANGKTFDARDFFRSLYAVGREPPKSVRKDKPGIEIHAKIDNVLGAHETSLRQVDLRFGKRGEQVTALDMKGMLEGGVPLVALLKPEAGRQRVVGIETANAGSALKLIGFYPNMAGGKGQLEINLEGRGAVEKTGRMQIKGFRILGDPIISEVFQNADETGSQENRPAIAAGTRRRVVREQIEFESLVASFSVGNAQVVIDDADARGPLVGVGLRGKLDFKSQRMDLGGTYVPLSGLNRVMGQIPILSPILTGPRGEGVLGIPFAITGPMAEPQVVFNPIALGAPGFLRELFQMGPQNSKVTPRTDSPRPAGAPQVRSSPPTEVRRPQDGRGVTSPEVIDGWSSSTTQSQAPGKR